MIKSSTLNKSKNTSPPCARARLKIWIFFFFFICQINLFTNKACAEDPFYLSDEQLKVHADELSKPIKKHKKFLTKMDLTGVKGEADLRKRIAQLKASAEEIVRAYDAIASAQSSKVLSFCAQLFSADLYWAAQKQLAQVKLPSDLGSEVRDALNRELTALARDFLGKAAFHYHNAVALSELLALSGHMSVQTARARLFDIETMAPDLLKPPQ